MFYGERVAVLGSNGSGKSHFLRLLAGGAVAYDGMWKLGARVVPGYFAQTHDHAELYGRTLVDILWTEASRQRGPAISALRRYELDVVADGTFDTLSGGQQARFQILLLELAGVTLLLLDEPTDNLDVASAEALEEGLAAFDGTVLAATHDRWFARSFDRFLVFGADGTVYEALEPVWDEARVTRPANGLAPLRLVRCARLGDAWTFGQGRCGCGRGPTHTRRIGHSGACQFPRSTRPRWCAGPSSDRDAGPHPAPRTAPRPRATHSTTSSVSYAPVAGRRTADSGRAPNGR